MRRTRLLSLALVTLLACHLGTRSPCYGARVEADPNNPYPIAPTAGGWLVCVQSYTGEKAAQMAHELVLEIRRRDNLPAYVYNRGEEERRKQQAERDRLRQQYPDANLSRVRTTRIEDQCAVLVGGYKDIETARRELERVKKLKPPSDRLMHFVSAVTAAQAPGNEKRGEVKGAHMNPFPSSFVVHNPTVPREQKTEPKQDPFLKQLNADEEYSLLKCRQPWTLVVKVFQGASTLQAKSTPSGGFLEKIGFGGSKTGEVLSASAMQAHEVAKVLRDPKLGFEAYVLHTRTQSIVTVGGFARPDDPKLQQVQRQLGGLKLEPFVKLFPQPIPMEVPRP